MMQAQPERDTRIDVLRALALLTIYIDHVPGTLVRAPDLQEFRIFGCGGSVRADLRNLRGARLWHEIPARHPPSHGAENVAARRRALCRAHRHDDGGARHLLPPPRSLRSGPSCCSRSTSSRSSARPAEALVGIVTLGHQIGYNNILSVYAVLLLAGAGLPAAGQHQAVAGARRSRARCGWRRACSRSRRPTIPSRVSGSSTRCPGNSCSTSAWSA